MQTTCGICVPPVTGRVTQLMKQKNQIKPLDSMLRIDAEKESKRRAGEAAEELDTLGQESEVKGAKWIIEHDKEQKKEEQRVKAIKEEILADARKKRETYARALMVDWSSTMKLWASELPQDGYWWVKGTPDAITLYMKVGDRIYGRATKISGEIKYDRNAMYRFITGALILANPDREESEIWTPNQKKGRLSH